MRPIAMLFALAACLSPVFVEAQNTVPATSQVKIKHKNGKEETLTVKAGETPKLSLGDSVTSVDGPAVTFKAPGGAKVTAQAGSSFTVASKIDYSSWKGKADIVSNGGLVSVTDIHNNTQSLAPGSTVEVAYYITMQASYALALGREISFIAESVQQDSTNPASRITP